MYIYYVLRGTRAGTPVEVEGDIDEEHFPGVDLGDGIRDFLFHRRWPQRQIFAPVFFNARPFLQKKEEIDRHHNEAEQETGDAEKAADTFLHDGPKFLRERGQITLEIRNYFFGFRFKLLPLSRAELCRRRGN